MGETPGKTVPYDESMARMYTPYGKTVLVTGGTKGIGRAVVFEMAKLGARVVTCARNEGDLKALLAACQEEGLWVQGCVADVSSPEGRADVVSMVTRVFDGKLNVLINNVGTNLPRRTTIEMTDEDFAMLFDINLKSAFSLSRDLYPLLKESGDGCVLFNSSVAGGPVAMRSGCLYGMSKASMNHLAKNLACEWSAAGIRALSVAPWYTKTPLAMTVLKNKEYEDAVLERTPMKRIAEPVEVARVISFLASPAASYMTGATIPVDGGYSVMGLY